MPTHACPFYPIVQKLNVSREASLGRLLPAPRRNDKVSGPARGVLTLQGRGARGVPYHRGMCRAAHGEQERQGVRFASPTAGCGRPLDLFNG